MIASRRFPDRDVLENAERLRLRMRVAASTSLMTFRFRYGNDNTVLVDARSQTNDMSAKTKKKPMSLCSRCDEEVKEGGKEYCAMEETLILLFLFAARVRRCQESTMAGGFGFWR